MVKEAAGADKDARKEMREDEGAKRTKARNSLVGLVGTDRLRVLDERKEAARRKLVAAQSAWRRDVTEVKGLSSLRKVKAAADKAEAKLAAELQPKATSSHIPNWLAHRANLATFAEELLKWRQTRPQHKPAEGG